MSMVNYSPQYVNKFSCLGSNCPETCCHGMMIDVDKETHSKYQKIKIEGIKNVGNNLKKKDNPTDQHFSVIKLKKDGHCSFLGNDGLCGIQKKYGEGYLSNTCNTFPRKNIDFAENKLQTMSMSCPEVARLCLSNKNSMEIIEDKFYKKKKFNLVSEKSMKHFDTPYATTGNLIISKVFQLLQNEKINYINSLVIINKLLEEQLNISKNPELFDKSYKFFYETFSNIDIISFDNSDLKILFLTDMFNIYNHIKFKSSLKNFSNHTLINLIKNSYHELVGRFDNVDCAVENLKKINQEFFSKFEQKNSHIFRNFFLNEILGYAHIVTNKRPYNRYNLYMSIFLATISKMILLGICSKEKREPTLEDFINIINRVERSNQIFFQFGSKRVDKNFEMLFNIDILKFYDKVDKNSLFNSTLLVFG